MALEPSDMIRDTHLKSLDVVLESSKKQLLELRAQFKKDPRKLAARERAFILKECTKLESIGGLQVKLDEYRENMKGLNAGKKSKEVGASGNSEKLGNHLRAIRQYRPSRYWQAHHIICSEHASHAVARFILFAYMGINDPHNGCWLPRKHRHATGTIIPDAVGHVYLHTEKYANWVSRI